MPMRSRSGVTDVNYGRCRTWRTCGRTDQEHRFFGAYGKVDTLVVDKTGTLTEGKPKVVAVVPAAGFDGADVLRLAASVERASEHPLADAIVRAATERILEIAPMREFNSPTGKGVTGVVGQRRVALENSKLLSELNVATFSSISKPNGYAKTAPRQFYVGG